ncbi:MAG: efflux RND transporter periplasmic adaptor subunit [Thermoanaerobaculia bacterium]|nr:efflux RND transporter periplasmic adaptor subunit [Thermoanaerobaculia bacterium]
MNIWQWTQGDLDSTVAKRRIEVRPLLTMVGLGMASLLIACGGPGQDGGAAPPPVPAVGVLKPVQQRVTDWEEFSGRLSAVQSVDVRARVSGFVERVHFTEGSLVEAGDLLFTLDPRTFRAELSRLEAQKREADVRLDLARSEAARVEPLIGSRAVSVEEVEKRRQDVASAEAAVGASQAALEGARLSVEFSRIVAPIAGRVGRAQVTRGNLVSGGAGDSTVLTTLRSIDPIYFYFTPDERTARRILDPSKPGTEGVAVDLFVGEGGESAQRGVIDFFDNSVDPSTGTLRLRAVFQNPDGALLPGMFGRLRVRIGEPHSALLVPDRAIGRDQTQQLLFIVGDDGMVERRVVTTGTLVDGWRVINTGLEAHEDVVVDGIQRARPGSKVDPQPAEQATPTGSDAPGASDS